MEYGNQHNVESQRSGHDGERHRTLFDNQDRGDGSERHKCRNELAEQGIRVDFENVLLYVLQRDEEVPYTGSLPADLLLEQRLHIVRNGRPALRIGVDHGSVSFEENLVREKPVFSIVDRDAEPIPR